MSETKNVQIFYTAKSGAGCVKSVPIDTLADELDAMCKRGITARAEINGEEVGAAWPLDKMPRYRRVWYCEPIEDLRARTGQEQPR